MFNAEKHNEVDLTNRVRELASKLKMEIFDQAKINFWKLNPSQFKLESNGNKSANYKLNV